MVNVAARGPRGHKFDAQTSAFQLPYEEEWWLE